MAILERKRQFRIFPSADSVCIEKPGRMTGLFVFENENHGHSEVLLRSNLDR